MAAVFVLTCILASLKRRAKQTSESSRWRLGGIRHSSQTPNAPHWRSPKPSALSDRADAVSDEIWNEAARHYDEPALAALVVQIGLINVFNRLNAATRQAAGEWGKSAERK